jgi:hypothetical protein
VRQAKSIMKGSKHGEGKETLGNVKLPVISASQAASHSFPALDVPVQDPVPLPPESTPMSGRAVLLAVGLPHLPVTDSNANRFVISVATRTSTIADWTRYFTSYSSKFMSVKMIEIASKWRNCMECCS